MSGGVGRRSSCPVFSAFLPMRKGGLRKNFRRICLSRTGKACISFPLSSNSFAKAPLLCPSAVGSPPGPLQPKGKVSPYPAD